MTPNHIFVKDLEGRFTLVNRTLAEAHCRRIEDLIGKTAEEFIPDAGVAKNLRHEDLEVIRTSREQFLAEAKLTTATGQVRWLQLVKCPLFAEAHCRRIEDLIGKTAEEFIPDAGNALR